MKMIGILGIAAVALAVGAADFEVTNMTNNAKVGKLTLGGKNRVSNGAFAIAALPASLTGEVMVSIPRGTGNQPGAAYSVTIDRPAKIYLFVQDRGKVTVPEGWSKTAGTLVWGDNFTDTIYVKDFDAGRVEVPAHDGQQGNNFGIPNAIVIVDQNKKLSTEATESLLTAKNRMRTAKGNFAFTEIPDDLKNLPLVSVERGAANQPGAAYTFELSKPAKLYLLVQNRGKITLPEGWTLEESKAAWSVGNAKYADLIYSKDFAPGTIEVPAHDGKEGASYGVPNAVVIQYSK